MILTRFIALYRRHFRDPRRERLFLASTAFFLSFGLVRLLAHSGRAANNEFRLLVGGVHVHHLVWGILLLLLVGYISLVRTERGNGSSDRLVRWTAILYGVAAALTLDEFALWLRLDDVYWQQEGRASVDVVMLFGALISCGLWGGPFLRGFTRQVARLMRRHPAPDSSRGGSIELPVPVDPMLASAVEARPESPGA